MSEKIKRLSNEEIKKDIGVLERAKIVFLIMAAISSFLGLLFFDSTMSIFAMLQMVIAGILIIIRVGYTIILEVRENA